MPGIGLELKAEREARHISVEEMASSTKIVSRYIQALEADRFDLMPGGFFVKGIVRTYVRYLGLDEAAVLAKYRAAGIVKDYRAGRSPAARSLPSFSGRNKTVIWVLGAAGVVVVLGGLVLLWRATRPSPPAGTQAAAVPQVQAVVPPPEPSPSAAPVQAEWKGVTIDITYREPTWLQIFADGVLKVEAERQPGMNDVVQADKEILIQVGNAGGFTFLLNGKPGRPFGRSAEVLKDIRITPDNLKDFLQDGEPREDPR